MIPRLAKKHPTRVKVESLIRYAEKLGLIIIIDSCGNYLKILDKQFDLKFILQEKKIDSCEYGISTFPPKSSFKLVVKDS